MRDLVTRNLASVESTDAAESSVQPNELEHRVEVLWLRAESGVDVSAGDVRDCARTYLRLRERWTGAVAA